MNRVPQAPAGVRAFPLDPVRSDVLLLRPDGDDRPEALEEWLRAHADWVAEALPRAGAFVARGFRVHDAPAFERIARAVAPDLERDYLGTSPREALTDHVFTASELPPVFPIPQHAEMSFVKDPPRHLFFWCDVPSEGPGGQTPLSDLRRVWRDVPADVRERLETRGIRIVRNYGPPGRRRDPWELKPWTELFGTNDKAEITRRCEENGFEAVWLPGDRLRIVSHQPASAVHPVTGEVTWFNHLQVFHLSSAADELLRVARLQRPLRNGMLALFAAGVTALRRRLRDADEHAMHCTYGDGTEIPDADVRRVRDAFWKNLVVTRWERGDVFLIDNRACAHGRMPYAGPRRVAVAWS